MSEDPATYKIVRKYKDDNHPGHNVVVNTGLSLAEAKSHCSSPDSEEEVSGSIVSTKNKEHIFMEHTLIGTCNDVCCHRVTYWLGGQKPLSNELKKLMDEHAEERAKECIIQGYNQGELIFIDQSNEAEYTGWWKIDNN